MALPNALNTYNFPDAYDSLVDAFTGTIKYISASTGSNSNTGNSVGSAYLTIDYALAQNTSATATMFVILEGTYTLTPTLVNGSSVGLTDGGNHREFVCAPGRVIIQHTASGGDRDSAIFHFANTNSKIYGAIIKRNNDGRTINYTVAYFKMGSAKGNFYNCVFSETNANNAWSYQYDNYGQNNLAIRNCTIYNGAAPASNYTNAGTCLTIDSVFNTTVTTGGTETNVLKSRTVNATTYVTTGVTTAGVYSGTYAWNGTTSFPDPGFVAPATVVSGSTINLVYYHTSSSATVAYTISGVTSADINGNSLTGNMTVTNSSATLSIPTTSKVATTNTLTVTAGAFTASVTITPGLTARYLVVAGGGGGGSDMGGGGGAGGYIAGFCGLTGSNNIVIGAGGAGGPAGTVGPAGSNGENTTAFGLTAIGGGGGASDHDSPNYNAGNGGSGGGGSGGRQSGGSYGGLPGTGTAGQGNNGAASGVTWYPGGGGGAGAAATQTGSQQANGGIGLANDILGTSYYWAGGGAGAGYTVYGGNGGLGGGGGGAPRQSNTVTTNGQGGGSALNSGSVAEIGTTVSQTNKRGGAGGANTGGGGGGGSHRSVTNEGGAGGSGIVVIRYAGSQRATGGTVTTVSGDTVHTFLTSSTLTVFTAGLNSSHTSAFWGETVTLVYADDLADGSTVAYAITGVTSEQIDGASLAGNFTISSLTATLSINLATRTTNTSATMVITAGAYSKTIQVSNIVSFTSSGSGTYWGGALTFTAQTRGLTAGGLVPYTISGVTSAQISNLTGNATNVPADYGYSALFNGTSSFLQLAHSTDFNLNGLAWTAECWIRPTGDYGAYRTIFCKRVTSSGTTAYQGYLRASTGVISFYNGDSYESSYTLAANVWSHCAWVYTGSTLNIYVNGSLVYSVVVAQGANNTQPFLIGGTRGYNEYFPGYISNFRLVKGVTVYTGTFTVPTNALTTTQSSGTNISAITESQTVLLTCQSATLIDNSVYARTITNTEVTVSNVAPLGNNALAAVGGGTATFVVVTNPSEPVLNSATMVTAIAGGSITNQIRTGSPAVFQGYKPSVVSLDYIDTEITDIHSEALEARVSSLVDIGSRVNPVQFSTTVTNIVHIDTEITDIHSQALEAKVSSVSDLNAKLHVIKSDTSIAGFVAAPTFAYSSGEDVKVSASATQTWYI